MLSISKEDAEFLAGFIDQWLPVCGEKTAERARAVRECLTSAASINQERGKFDREPWDKFLSAHSIKTIPVYVERVVSAGGGGGGSSFSGVSGYYIGHNEPLYDGKPIAAAFDLAIEQGARFSPQYLGIIGDGDTSSDEELEHSGNYWQDGENE